MFDGEAAGSLGADGTMRLNPTRNDTEIIAEQVGVSINIGDAYLTEVEQRADRAANVNWDNKQDVPPWRRQTARTNAADRADARHDLLQAAHAPKRWANRPPLDTSQRNPRHLLFSPSTTMGK